MKEQEEQTAGPYLCVTLPSGTKVLIQADKLLIKDEWEKLCPLIQFVLRPWIVQSPSLQEASMTHPGATDA